ncbi:MAG: hypothetical protein QGI83_06290 [Candidatus Latescibacteria bacterium]|jgi:hypothetical protein|nr:hypothetical protein [Candidatus Latescibacterota bacterium]
MEICDYGRSYVTFVTEGRANNARLQVESVCTLTDSATGETQEYLFFASCKSEHTYAERDLFHEDNYDFCGIFSEEEYAIFRTHSTHTDRFREEGLWRDRFQDVVRQVVRVEGTELGDRSEVVAETLKSTPLIGQVEIASGDGALRAHIEFPIKTMNANDIQNIFQVDTGPVAFPDFAVDVKLHIERLSPAYVAYNAPDFADFVVQEELAVGGGGGGIAVTHYSRLVSLPATTRVLAME